MLDFKTLIIYLLSQSGKAASFELFEFFQTKNKEFPYAKIPTSSALSQARKNLKPEVFQELNYRLIKHFYRRNKYDLWNGLRVVALDGTSFQLPKNHLDTRNMYMHNAGNNQMECSMNLAALYDPINDLVLDVAFGNRKIGEQTLALDILNKLNNNDILIADRGFSNTPFLVQLTKRKLKFCIRMTMAWNDVKELWQSGKNEMIMNIKDGQNPPIQVRLIRVKLSSGEPEVLATNLLDKKKFNAKIFKQLYAKRWNIEECFKMLKTRLRIENWTGETPIAIAHDIYSKFLVMNMLNITIGIAEKLMITPNRSISKAQALIAFKPLLINIITSTQADWPPGFWAILLRSTYINKPNRSFPRKQRTVRYPAHSYASHA